LEFRKSFRSQLKKHEIDKRSSDILINMSSLIIDTKMKGELCPMQYFEPGTVVKDVKLFGAYHPIVNGIEDKYIICGFGGCKTLLCHYNSFRNHLRKVHSFSFRTVISMREHILDTPPLPTRREAATALVAMSSTHRMSLETDPPDEGSSSDNEVEDEQEV